MAVQPTDLTFFKSSHKTTSANNTNGNEIKSLGGQISAEEMVSGTLNDLFDVVTTAEASAGRVEYRCIYAVNKNVTPQTLFAAKMYILANTTATDTNIEIAVDPAPAGSDSTIEIADEIDSTNLLSGLTFVAAPDFDNAIDLGDLVGNNGKRAIWIKRTIGAGAAAQTETATVRLIGDSDA